MNHNRRGFSLVELVVVMVILAALATVAVRSVGGVKSQGQYQQTVRSLNEVRDAIISAAGQRNLDGSPLVTGFVADTGNLPIFVAGPDPLAELTTNPNAIPIYTQVFSASDPTIAIGAGWQGPYLRLSAGATALIDGWGNPFYLYGSSTLLTSTGTPIDKIASYGQDGIADTNEIPAGTGDTNGYNPDITVPIPSSGVGSYVANLTGTLKILDTSGNPIIPLPNSSNGNPATIYVVYFGPNGGAVQEVKATQAANPLLFDLSGTNGQFNTTGTIGPRILRAYVLQGAGATFNASSVSLAYARSNAISVAATGGGQTLPTLVISNYTP